jgi:hypothetical protein
MSTRDVFEHDDAAYVLGALSEPERLAFEAHLATCAACTARVREISALPGLLVGAQESDFDDPGTPPETLLPGLLRRAGAERRRQRWLVGGLAGLAAAFLIALLVSVLPSNGGSGAGGHAQAMQVVVASPVRATATLVERKWGTQINLDCTYSGVVVPGGSYDLRVYSRTGTVINAGTWRLVSGSDTKWSGGVALAPSQISRVEITRPDGQAVLRLNT